MGRMAADNVEFHEMGLDDRLLKVNLSFFRYIFAWIRQTMYHLYSCLCSEAWDSSCRQPDAAVAVLFKVLCKLVMKC